MPDVTTGVSGDVSGLDDNLTKIIFAGTQAWGLLALQNPDLANQLKTKFREDGYKYSAGLQALISKAPASLQHPLYAYYSNPAAVKQSISGAFSQAFGSIAQNLALAPAKAGQAIEGLAKGLAGIQVPGFLAALTSKQLWLRVAEVVIGLLLLGVGVAKLTNAVPLATKLATKLA